MKTCTHGFEKYSQMLLGENQYSMRIAICLDIERRLYKFFYASAVNIRDLLSQLKNQGFDVPIHLFFASLSPSL